MLRLMWRITPVRARTVSTISRNPRWSLSGRRAYAKVVSSGLFDGEHPRDHRIRLENGGGRVPQHSQIDDKVDQAFDPTSSKPLTFLGTATTSAPSATTIDKLVQKLGENSYGRWIESDHSSLELTLLFTPSYAQSALSTQIPLEVIARLCNGSILSASIDVVTAVVDRLPCTHGNTEGAEGLAYHIRTGSFPFERAPELLEPSAEKPGSLTFVPVRNRQVRNFSTAIQLPLAQTIFSTTLPSTLLHIRYQLSPLTGEYQVLESKNLEAYTVPILLGTRKRTRDYKVPLTPVTMGRKVKNSMGNIVRKVSSSLIKDEPQQALLETPVTGSSIPASQELESAISTYFQELQMQPEPVQVWALIIPSHHDMPQMYSAAAALLSLDQRTIRDSWQTAPSHDGTESTSSVAGIVDNGVPALLANGARLCRVLSGGGGWGKKAGLLSFDPDTSYSTRDLRHDRGWEFSFDEDDSPQAAERQQKQALGEVVREGEGVMFFLAPKPQPRAQNVSLPNSGSSTVTFGVLPSSIDEVPASAETVDPTASAALQVEHHEGIFGMLSEGGMAIKQIRQTLDGPQKYAESKLDVPYARLSITAGNDIRQRAIRADQQTNTKSTPDQLPATGARQSSTGQTVRRVMSRVPDAQRSGLEEAWASVQTGSSKPARGTNIAMAPQSPSKHEHEIIDLVEGYIRTK